MKSLGRTIDKILKAVPSLEPQLTPIRSKWKRFPARTMNYWKELVITLNSDRIAINEDDRSKIKNILVSKPKQAKQEYTLEEAGPNETVVGVIPEYLADRIKRHDLLSVKMAKMQVEATMTRNMDMATKIHRQASKMEIDIKKIWFEIKEHFNLWDKDGKFVIKKKGPVLVLLDDRPQTAPAASGAVPEGFMLKVDLDTLRGLFKMLGIDPPPGFPAE